VPDAKRDVAFERGASGKPDRVDPRPKTARVHHRACASATASCAGAGRGSLRPGAQGSLADLSLGAFPRWREPKKSPDAALYD
jgi:hypothetical protein